MNLWECSCQHCRVWRVSIQLGTYFTQALAVGRDPDEVIDSFGELPPSVVETMFAIADATPDDLTTLLEVAVRSAAEIRDNADSPTDEPRTRVCTCCGGLDGTHVPGCAHDPRSRLPEDS